MITLTLANGNEITIHTGYKELSHSSYIDFQFGKLNYIESLMDENPDNFKPEIMAEALSFVVEGDLAGIPFMLEEDNIDSKTLPGLREGVSLWRLYNYYENIMAEYDPSETNFSSNEYVYTYNGVDYVLSLDRAMRSVSKSKARYDTDPDNLGEDGKPLMLQFSTIEVIEVNTLYFLLKKSKKATDNNDAVKVFSTDIQMLALLLRPRDEEIPILKKERDEWLIRRGRTLQNVPNYVIKDVTFFLSRTSKMLRLAKSMELSFLVHRNLKSTQELDKILMLAMKNVTGKLINKHTKST